MDQTQGIGRSQLSAVIEALLFVAGEPLPADELARAAQCEPAEVEKALGDLSALYENDSRGIRLSRVNGSAYLCTNRAYSEYVLRLLQPSQKRTFSQSMMETLSVVAYKQPVTRAEIEAVRGVRCEYAVSQLIHMNMIEEIGRKDTIGRPALFATTDTFLRHFGLASLNELPDKQLFEKMDFEGSDQE